MSIRTFFLFVAFALSSLGLAQGSLEEAYLGYPLLKWACVNEQKEPRVSQGVNTCVLMVSPPPGAVDAREVQFEAYVSYSYMVGSEPDWYPEEGVDGPIKVSAPLVYGERRFEVFRVLKPYKEAFLPVLQKWFNWSKVASYVEAASDAVYTGLPTSIRDVATSVLFVPLLKAQRERAYPGGSLTVTLWVRVCGVEHCTRAYRIRF